MRSKLTPLITALLAGSLLAFALAGCTPAVEAEDDASKNRQYLSLLSSSISDLDPIMDEFEAAAADQNVVAMKNQLGKVSSLVARIADQEATPALGDVRDLYVSGLEALEGAMASYVSLYESAQGGALSAEDIQAQLDGIQSQYDDAVTKLQEADDTVSELSE